MRAEEGGLVGLVLLLLICIHPETLALEISGSSVQREAELAAGSVLALLSV